MVGIVCIWGIFMMLATLASVKDGVASVGETCAWRGVIISVILGCIYGFYWSVTS